ncbi:putative RNA-binding protein sce3 [Madurella mycetomatis]|uniref:Putative RNA-binding protein sce3 n=1 Tax=Madurella mycetomatis TaxID=100816 RepID=A0A175VX94_9PEZI|nr:putative RNA-binding protein sce3 [Madurella mycetomatis]KXX75789.1 putative RNA-binding protein sce3 [Madurella mycetomatis]
MAPKKKQEVQKLSLGDFLNDSSFGGGGSASWADEVEDTYGTQPLPPSERRGPSTSYGGNTSYGYHSLRDNLPQKLPDKPPFTAHLGNLSYDATVESVTEFFEGCDVVSVRIIEDREQNRPKGFAYAEFADLEGLKTALTRDGVLFEGRNIRIKVADPPRGGFERTELARDLDWSQRRGPLADLPGRGGDRRGPDFGERRGPRDFGSSDDGKVRDFGNWERRGPLSPLSPSERPESREGSRPRTNEGRSESFRGARKASPAAWGPGEGRQDGSRPPRREFAERPERAPTAAEKDFNWRNNMRPDSAKSPGQSHEGTEAPPSPAGPAAAQPAGRPKLNLAKRTVSEATDATPVVSGATDSKASPFGAARPIDTAAREREIEERRQKEKREAEERAKEEKRAREAAAKEAAEKAAAEEAAKANEVADVPADETKAAAEEGAVNSPSGEQKIPIRPREAREGGAGPKSRATESGNWRQASGEQRAPSRGGHAPSGPRRGGAPRGPRSDAGRPPRSNGNNAALQQPQSPSVEQSPSTPTVDEDGWTMVPNKSRRGQGNRPIAP